ncbi:MAG: hypothetical protein EBU31_02490 [Proteobacteria bacterium]|nr:hypothetical protein [Pseudomonadota bacterium]
MDGIEPAGHLSATYNFGLGDVTTSADFTPGYVAPTARKYLELTQDSIALFQNICSGGLTGTFTFHTTQTMEQAGLVLSFLRIQSGYARVSSDNVSTGDAFSVTIQSALSMNAALTMSATPQDTNPTNVSTTWRYPENAYLNSLNQTVYLASPVPAPGAAALLAVAGALGGRRRRG